MSTPPRFSTLVTGYIAGLAAGHAVPVPGAAAVAVALAGALLAWRASGWGVPAAALVGMAAGSISGAAIAGRCAGVWAEGSRVSFIARIHDAPATREATSASVLHAVGGCGGTVRLRAAVDLPAGAKVIVLGRHRAHGVVRVDHVRVLDAPRSWRFRLRDVIARRVRSLYGERAPLIEAMVLGRKDDLTTATRRRFASAGLAHLLAISGLHVGIFALWITWIGRQLGLGARAQLMSIPVVWSYVLVLGFPAPATRAATFLTAYALARRWQRHPPPSAILALGVAAVVVIDPAAVRSVGAWLSAAAVWGVGQGMRLARRQVRSDSPLVKLLAASCGATLATAPITAFAFGQVAPIGVVANLVGVPLASVAVPGILTSLVAGPVIATGAGVVLAALERWVALMAAVPWGTAVGASGIAFALPWAALLVAIVWLTTYRRTLRLARVALVSAVLIAWVPATLEFVRRDRETAPLAVHILDVGQGDAIALRTPAGRWILVDAGPRTTGGDAGRRVVAPFLRRRGVDQLAALIISHGDADHVGGAATVMQEIGANLVLDPGQPLPSAMYLDFLAAVDGQGAEWNAARAGDSLQIDGVQITVLHPSSRWLRRDARPNEGSLVLLVRYGCFEALLTGDAGLPVEDLLGTTITGVDFLKVSHHGSRSATGTEFLQRLDPLVAAVSVGPNRYGHPAPEVMDRLREQGARVYRTDRHGTVTLRTDGRYLEVETEQRTSLGGRISCLRHWLRLSDSSSSRSGCTRKPRVSLPVCSTTSLSHPRSSRATSDGRDW